MNSAYESLHPFISDFHRIAEFFQDASDIVITTDALFRVVSMNDLAERIYATSLSEIKGKPIQDLAQYGLLQGTIDQIRSAISRHGKWEGESRLVNRKDQAFEILYSVRQMKNETRTDGYFILGKDITAHKKVYEELRKKEQFYRALTSDSMDGMLLVKVDGTITFMATYTEKVLGFKEHELVGRNAFEFVHPEDHLIAMQAFQNEVGNAPVVKYIVARLLCKDGRWMPCLIRGNNLMHNPDVNGIAIYFHDDTPRQQAVESLRKSEARFRNLVEGMNTGVVMQDAEGRIVMVNEAFTSIFDVEPAYAIGAMIDQLAVHPIHENGRPFLPSERPSARGLQEKQQIKDCVMGVIRKQSADRVWLLINSVPVLNEQGEMINLISTIQDITERKRQEQLEIQKTIAHQKQLTQATIDGQEKERIEIGEELHDNIGQQLTTIKLFLDMARSSADEQTGEMIAMALKGVADTINEVRSLSRALVPSTLKDLGLMESLDELSHLISRSRVMKVILSTHDFDETKLAENQKLTLYRITQEQLNNIVKHAGASEVRVELYMDASQVFLSIQDNGRGFDPRMVKKGLGFVNMKNRAELFGGSAEICSRSGAGCSLKVRFPIFTEDRIMTGSV